MRQRLKRLGKAFVDGLYSEEDYRREKRVLEEKAMGLSLPTVDVALEAGKLLEDLPRLWDKVDLSEKRKLLLAMLDGVYVDAKMTRSVVGIRPKPAFMPLFALVTAKEGSGVTLNTRQAPTTGEPDTGKDPVFMVEMGGSRTPRPKDAPSEYLQACPILCVSLLGPSTGGVSKRPADIFFGSPHRRQANRTSIFWCLLPALEERLG